jgi:hypothetical protein
MNDVKYSAIMAAIVLFMQFGFADSLSVHELIQKLNLYNDRFPTEKVYLKSNKSVFKPGEDIWFKAYVVESRQNRPLSMSTNLTVKIIDENGADVFNNRFKINKGTVSGVLNMPLLLEEGNYVLVAYTNWMQNGSAKDVFSQEIMVVNSVPPSFFLQVELLDSLYHPMDVVRTLIKMRSRKGASIKKNRLKYVIRAGNETFIKGKQKTNKEGFAQIEYPLPNDIAQNYITLNIQAKYKRRVETRTVLIPTSDPFVKLEFFPEGGNLISGIKTNIAFGALDRYGNPFDFQGEVINQYNERITELKSFHDGMGVFSITPQKDDSYRVRIIKPKRFHQTFDLTPIVQNGIALSIVRQDRDFITVKAETNLPEEQKTYCLALVRGQIYWAAIISIKDSTVFKIPIEGFPFGIAQISIFDNTGVSKAERLVFVNHQKRINLEISPVKKEYRRQEKVNLAIIPRDENGTPIPMDMCLTVIPENRLYTAAKPNILATLLLTSELNRSIVNPNFYFKKSPEAERALDYLLMTQELRSFTWEKIVEMDENMGMAYISKGAVSGTVYLDGKPVKEALVWLVNIEGQAFETKTDEQGKFQAYSDGTTILDVILIRAQTPGGNDQVKIVHESFAERVNNLFTLSAAQKVQNALKLDRYKYSEDWTDPETVAEAILIDKHFSKVAEAAFKDEKIPPWKSQILTSGIMEAIRMVKIYRISGNRIFFQGSSSLSLTTGALIVVDGVKMGHDYQLLEGIDPFDVEDIQVHLSNTEIQKFDSFAVDGVIEITTKMGPASDAVGATERRQRTMENPFWVPIIQMDETGALNFNYSNPDAELSLMGIIEGIGADGELGRIKFEYIIH